MKKAVGTNMITESETCSNCHKPTTNEMIINTISFTMCKTCEEKINASFSARKEEEEEYATA
ncbi:MAG: hypothetical protein CMA72_08260 [Euryarchaeota archaeon]|nr:hypothetical protein [Euryarchaeota archaeon]|tara:strand:+ start:1216 stop:1401 length:186 start_codon:yes stop_codon:yes gene_type:complete